MTRTMRTLTTAAVLGAALATSTAARAQTRPELGEKGQFILSADRLVPLVSWNRIAQDDYGGGAYTTTSVTSFSFFWGTSGGTLNSPFDTAQAEEAFFSVPRVGLDYVIVPHVTIGGDIALFFTAGSTGSRTNTANDNTISGGNGAMIMFGVAPRAGYLLHLSDMWTLWLRGGISFYTGTVTSARALDGTYTHANVDQFAADLEPQIVFTPVPHFGITAAVNADIPIVGRHSLTGYASDGNVVGEESASASITMVGLTLGMIGYF